MSRKVFKTKKEFQPAYTIFNTKKDWDLEPECLFAMATDPSKKLMELFVDVLTRLMSARESDDSMSEEELNQLNADFFYCVSELIVDCDIKGLDFSTPEKAEESMNNTDIDWHFMLDVLGRYVSNLFFTHRTLGRASRTPSESENSGSEQ